MRRPIGILMVLLTISLIFPLIAYGHGGDTTKIHSCANNNSGEVKIVGANDSCGNNETALDWAITPVLQFTTPPTWSQTLPATERFVLVMGGAAVLDRETGLVWERSPDTDTRTWFRALSFCYDRVVGGRKGLRLPTIEELASLVDADNLSGNPVLPPGHPFINVQSARYWAATTFAGDTTTAWGVNFASGGTGNGSQGKAVEADFVWCVRGGQGIDGGH